ncbi:Rid family detoxifying hydrolase [Blattabacterium cuenoti]|uniref:Rid family detoxifying hydrolase n=1 Tax=Blattabacterium cuenoti TaxID=1653831 RepID=UPI00163BDF14|nr:Rid family detoxifying hydrolase [Blattabacterium cuenoti]
MKPKKFLIEKIPSYGPYSTCIFVENFLFVSGQIANIEVESETNKLIRNSIEMETNYVMNNLKIILLENKMGFQDVIKTSIFVKNMNDFSIINEVYSRFFNKGDYPARETVQVSGLPKRANVEISLIAYKKK